MIQTATTTKDAFGEPIETWVDAFDVWAQRVPLRDGERWDAGEIAASVTDRFTVRWSTKMAAVTPRDRLCHEGRVFEITGIKETRGRRRFIEITASARNDTV